MKYYEFVSAVAIYIYVKFLNLKYNEVQIRNEAFLSLQLSCAILAVCLKQRGFKQQIPLQKPFHISMNIYSVPRTAYFPVVIILSINAVVPWYLLLLWSVGVCSITIISIYKYQAVSTNYENVNFFFPMVCKESEIFVREHIWMFVCIRI